MFLPKMYQKPQENQGFCQKMYQKTRKMHGSGLESLIMYEKNKEIEELWCRINKSVSKA